MALNMCEMWFNGIKIAFFSKKLQKIAQQLGALPPDPQSLRPLGAQPPDPRSVIRLSYTGFLKTSPKLRICSFQLYQFKPSPFAKSWLSAKRQIFDDVIACDLWFRLSQSKILAMPINWRLPEKKFWRPFFFWRTLAAVSLVLGLGLEHSCPWPQEGLFSERLSLALASEFLCPWPRPRALCPRLHLCFSQPEQTKNKNLTQLGSIKHNFTISKEILQASGWGSNGVSHCPNVSRRIYELSNRRGFLCVATVTADGTADIRGQFIFGIFKWWWSSIFFWRNNSHS